MTIDDFVKARNADFVLSVPNGALLANRRPGTNKFIAKSVQVPNGGYFSLCNLPFFKAVIFTKR